MSDDRLVAVEMALAHLQRDVEQLNSVLLEQRRELDALRRVIERVELRVEESAEPAEKRNPIDERPPHY